MSPLVQPMPVPRFQFFNSAGLPVANGFLYTYAAGTNTPLATYNDHTGSGGALNPNPVLLDSGGYADVWLTASSYKLVLKDANGVQIWSIDGVPGLGSLISVGDLPPLFTSTFAAGGLSFNLSNAAANTLFGRFAGTSGAPSYGAVGSDKQVTFNKSGGMLGSADLLWDDTGKVLTVGNTGSPQVRLTGDGSGGDIKFGSGSQPIISFATDWFFTAANGQAIDIGQPAEQKCIVIGPTLGQILIGRSSHFGQINLNDGSSGAGLFSGLNIIAGSIATPESVVSAPTGSIFLTTNGGSGTTLWVKESSPTADTGWIGK